MNTKIALKKKLGIFNCVRPTSNNEFRSYDLFELSRFCTSIVRKLILTMTSKIYLPMKGKRVHSVTWT